MSSQKQDDPLLEALFTGLKDFLNAPLPGTDSTRPSDKQEQAPAVNDDSLLEKLNEIFNAPLPGTATGKTASSPDPSAQQNTSDNSIDGWNRDALSEQPEDWDDLRERHKDQREALSERHKNEREAQKERHKMERESLKEARKSRKRDKDHRKKC